MIAKSIATAVIGCILPTATCNAQASSAPIGRVEYYYGTTCGPNPPQGSPRIDVFDPPILGGVMVVVLYDIYAWKYWQGCIVGGTPFLALGTSRSSIGGLALPLLLPSSLTFGYPCWLLTSTDVSTLGSLKRLSNVGSSHSEIAGIPVPNNQALLGQTIYLQWLVHVGAGGGSCPFIYDHWFTSNGAAVVIGR